MSALKYTVSLVFLLVLVSAANSETTQDSEAGQAKAGKSSQVGPGQFSVDEIAAERALERTLVQTGGLLLEPWQLEVNAAFSFSRDEQAVPVILTQNDATILAQDVYRRSDSIGNLQLFLGLPGDLQFELGVPYQQVEESRVTNIGFTGLEEIKSTGSGIGDLTIRLAKTMVREKAWRPDLIARLEWNTDTGEERDHGVTLGSNGFNEYRAALRATKRQDPLVFTLGFGYEVAQKANGVRPGNRMDISLGAILAASPETSLLMSLDQTFVGQTRTEGKDIIGSDRIASVLTLGTSSILGRRMFLAVVVGVGLTEEAADYSVSFNISKRFDFARGSH